MKCGLCGGVAQLMGRTHEYRIGEPLCKGPVCQFCYENKVIRAQKSTPTLTSGISGEQKTPENIHNVSGFWLIIADSGEEYMTSNPKDLVFHMLNMGFSCMAELLEGDLAANWEAPEHCETPEELLESKNAYLAEHFDNFITPGKDYFDALWINL